MVTLGIGVAAGHPAAGSGESSTPAPVDLGAWSRPPWFAAATIADQLWQKGDRAGAIQRWEEAVKKGFRDGIVFYHLGMFYQEQEDWEKAVRYLSQAIPFLHSGAVSPEIRPKAYQALAGAHLKLKNYGEAYVDYQKALKYDPTLPETHLGLGMLYLLLGKEEAAELEAQKVLSSAPRHDKALWILARAAELRGEPERAAELYREVLKIVPDWWETRLNLGILLHKQLRRRDEAERELNEVIARAPASASAHAVLSHLYLERGDLVSAAAAADRALALDPANGLALVVRGTIAIQGGDIARAEELFTAAAAGGGGALAHYGLGLVASHQKDFGTAETCFRAALEEAPTFTEARYNLAVTLEAQGRRPEACEQLVRLLADDPDFGPGQIALGKLYYSSGDLPEAITRLRNALVLDRDAWEAHYFLGKCRYDRGEYASAVESFSRALASRPDNPALLSDLAMAYEKTGKVDEAERALRRALESNPHHVRSMLLLAALQSRSRRDDEAGQLYRQALILKPGEATWGYEGEADDFLSKLVSGLDNYLSGGISYLSLFELLKNMYRDRPVFHTLIPVLKQKAAAHPRTPHYAHLLGLAYQEVGRTVQAEEEYRKALSFDSDFAPAHLSLGYLYAQQGKPAQARPHLEAFLTLSPDSTLAAAVRSLLSELAAGSSVGVAGRATPPEPMLRNEGKP